MWFKRGSEQVKRVRGAPSILGSDLKIEGDIVSEGELHISGSVRGDVVARDLTLDDGGSITGTVKADIAIIAGNFAGKLTATSTVLAPTARVVADLTHVSLTIEQGAVFEGFGRHVDTLEATVHTARLKALTSSEAKPA